MELSKSTIAVIISILNLAFALFIYLITMANYPEIDVGGKPLLSHAIISIPVTLLLTFWLAFMSEHRNLSSKYWKYNALGLIIPVIGLLSGSLDYSDSAIVGIILYPWLIYLMSKEYLKGAANV